MKIFKAAVCDDDRVILDMTASTLVSCFKSNDAEILIDKYETCEELIAAYKAKSYDVLFLDIEMSGKMNGIAAGKKLRSLDDKATIIYISGREDKVFDTFEGRPFAFVRKDKFLGDLSRVIKRFLDSATESVGVGSLELKTSDGLVRVKIDNVTYIECIRDYQYFHISDGETQKVKLRMNIMEEKLADFGFIRVHQGYLVNYRYIMKIKNEAVELSNGVEVPISRRKKQEVLFAYMRLSRASESIMLAPKNAQESDE